MKNVTKEIRHPRLRVWSTLAYLLQFKTSRNDFYSVPNIQCSSVTQKVSVCVFDYHDKHQ